MIRGRAAAPALQALRTYWATTLLLLAACSAGMAVMLPVTALARWTRAGIVPALSLPPMRATDFGIVWGAFAQTPAEVRQAAVSALVRLLLGVAVGVLAVTWLTTLSVSMARASGRATEIGVRRAVGAARRQLLEAALLEGAALSALALVVGGAAGVTAARLSLGAWPGAAASGAHGVGLVAVGATLGGVVLGALLPLLHARRSSRMTAVEPTPLGLLGPALQLGVSLTVLVAASLLASGGARLTPAASRSAADAVYQVATRGVPPAERSARYAMLLRATRAESGVRLASLTSPGTLAALGPVDMMVTHCGLCRWADLIVEFHTFSAVHLVASADTFQALRLRLASGRWFTDADDWRASRVAVVSRTLAERHFQNGDAVGRRLHVGHGTESWYTVVGVVDDRQATGFGGALQPREVVYLSVLQHPPTAADLLVRGRVADDALGGVARAIRGTLGPGAVAARVSEAGLLAAEAAPVAWFARMFGVEGWGLLVVATLGTFAMMWLWVTSLLAELGVRRAVGARRRHVMGYVLWRALLVAVGASAFGSWLGIMVWDALRGLVSGLPAWDPGALLRYALLLCGAALAGALLPAWRAAHAQPTTLLAAGLG